MLHQCFATLVRTAAFALFAALGALGTAHSAVVVTGEWDPSVGGPFPELGWRGTAEFSVPDACLALTGTVLNTDPCSSGSIAFLGATIQFYDTSIEGPAPTIVTLTLGALALSVNSIDVAAEDLTGVDSSYSNFAATDTPTDFDSLDLYVFSLKFDPATGARLVFTSAANAASAPAGFDTTGSVAVASVTYTPEPSSLGLVLGGLAAAAVVRARRRR